MSHIHYTDAVQAELYHEAEKFNTSFDTLIDAVHASAGSFISSVYFDRSAWFRDQPAHVFAAFRATPKGGKTEEVRLAIRRLKGAVEIDSVGDGFTDDYWVARVIEETKVDEHIA